MEMNKCFGKIRKTLIAGRRMHFILLLSSLQQRSRSSSWWRWGFGFRAGNRSCAGWVLLTLPRLVSSEFHCIFKCDIFGTSLASNRFYKHLRYLFYSRFDEISTQSFFFTSKFSNQIPNQNSEYPFIVFSLNSFIHYSECNGVWMDLLSIESLRVKFWWFISFHLLHLSQWNNPSQDSMLHNLHFLKVLFYDSWDSSQIPLCFGLYS